ncbi:hypothetical protein V8C43DRAFT_228007 [Trichoderma afarasin]
MRRDGPRYEQELLYSSVAALPCTFGRADITEGCRCPISQSLKPRPNTAPAFAQYIQNNHSCSHSCSVFRALLRAVLCMSTYEHRSFDILLHSTVFQLVLALRRGNCAPPVALGYDTKQARTLGNRDDSDRNDSSPWPGACMGMGLPGRIGPDSLYSTCIWASREPGSSHEGPWSNRQLRVRRRQVISYPYQFKHACYLHLHLPL